MKKLLILITVFMLFAVSAYAGAWGTIKTSIISMISPEAFINGVLLIFSVIFAGLYAKIKTTLNETRNFVDAVDDAVSDDKITKTETQAIIAKKEAVINPWKKTPNEFK